MTKDQIIAVYESIEESDPDISTERLLAQTADACKCQIDNVTEALHQTQPPNP